MLHMVCGGCSPPRPGKDWMSPGNRPTLYEDQGGMARVLGLCLGTVVRDCSQSFRLDRSIRSRVMIVEDPMFALPCWDRYARPGRPIVILVSMVYKVSEHSSSSIPVRTTKMRLICASQSPTGLTEGETRSLRQPQLISDASPATLSAKLRAIQQG
ncbi:hypothetical protein LIA77_11761 [Sarocladium implicatum]|nr:hypothetical protein LIA77_11761 [Sarocladium implicatum]